MSAARANGTAEIGLAVAATTFSIIAVFMPVAFMGGGAGEWFRPFAPHGGGLGAGEPLHLVHAGPDALGLLGRPGRLPRRRRSSGIRRWLATLQRLVRPPGRPLRQRDRLGAAPPQVDGDRSRSVALVGALVLQVTVGGSEFLPPVRLRHDRDRRAHALQRRASSTRSSRWSRPRSWRARCPRRKATNSYVNAGGGPRVRGHRQEHTAQAHGGRRSPRSCASRSHASSAPSTRCWTTSTTARSKPVQIRFYGPRLAPAHGDHQRLHGEDAQDPGRGRRRAVGAGAAATSCKIELDRGLANAMGISVGDAAQALRVAFAGVEVGDWVDPDRRGARRRGAPASRRPRRRRQHRAPADRRRPGSDMMVPLDQIATITMGKGPAQIQHPDGKRMIAVSANAQGRSSGEVTADAMKLAKADRVPGGLRHHAGRRLARPEGSVQRDVASR